MAKQDARLAEVAAQHYCHVVLDCTITRRAIRTRFQKVDLFGCDVMGRREDGSCVWIQVTAGKSANVAQRRRKLEAIPWNVLDDVRLLELRRPERGIYTFRVHRYVDNEWIVDPGIFWIPRSWFKAYRPDEKVKP